MSLDLFWEKHMVPPGRARPGASQVRRREPDAEWGRVGLLANQTAYHFAAGEYLFQGLARIGRLHRMFLPEHGMFAELQDQVALDSGAIYERLAPGVDFVSLYGSQESSLFARPELLADLDTLVIDLQDVGSRYYTFATTVSYIFDVLAEARQKLRVLVIERHNPAGPQVEGTCLPETYQSFVGKPGLPHRHGLSLGELCRFYQATSGAPIELEIVGAMDDSEPGTGGDTGRIDPGPLGSLALRPWQGYLQSGVWSIGPSPNMPGPLTPLVYSGQCLLEGTNLNEGRGTTRPFEIFGAPYLDWIWKTEDPASTAPVQDGAVLRPLQYMPTFHKFGGETCHGFQIHVADDGVYHSLAHTLKLLRWIQERCADAPASFAWKTDAYEFRSDRPAIEILAGDALLLDYLRGSGGVRCADLRAHLAEGEQVWLTQAREFTSVARSRQLFRVDLRADQDYL